MATKKMKYLENLDVVKYLRIYLLWTICIKLLKSDWTVNKMYFCYDYFYIKIYEIFNKQNSYI